MCKSGCPDTRKIAFRLTQTLTQHGCFLKYLERIGGGKWNSKKCTTRDECFQWEKYAIWLDVKEDLESYPVHRTDYVYKMKTLSDKGKPVDLATTGMNQAKTK